MKDFKTVFSSAGMFSLKSMGTTIRTTNQDHQSGITYWKGQKETFPLWFQRMELRLMNPT